MIKQGFRYYKEYYSERHSKSLSQQEYNAIKRRIDEEGGESFLNGLDNVRNILNKFTE